MVRTTKWWNEGTMQDAGDGEFIFEIYAYRFYYYSMASLPIIHDGKAFNYHDVVETRSIFSGTDEPNSKPYKEAEKKAWDTCKAMMATGNYVGISLHVMNHLLGPRIAVFGEDMTEAQERGIPDGSPKDYLQRNGIVLENYPDVTRVLF